MFQLTPSSFATAMPEFGDQQNNFDSGSRGKFCSKPGNFFPALRMGKLLVCQSRQNFPRGFPSKRKVLPREVLRGKPCPAAKMDA
jgi:hypothetical protein